jgi:hypothetical protein
MDALRATCGKCDGSGVYKYHGEPAPEPCRMCGGRGFIRSHAGARDRACDMLRDAALLLAAAGCSVVRVDGAGFVVTVDLRPAPEVVS